MTRDRKLGLVLALISLLAAFVGMGLMGGENVAYGQNLLTNSGFERLDEAGMPLDWLSDAYDRRPDVSEFVLAKGREGNGVMVRNLQANDARFIQTVPVRPDTLYELSGWVLADVENGRGANLSIADVYQGDEGFLSTGGEWRQLTVYGRTTADQTELTVYLRLGGYSADSVGEAIFDDVSLKAVRSASQGADVQTWETWQPRAIETKDPKPARPAWPMIVAIGALWVLVALSLAYKAEQSQARPELPGEKNGARLWLLVLLFSALFVRLVLAMFVEGYGVDIGCFTSWANRMALKGPADFYLMEGHSDYPPGYMLVLWPLGLMGQIFGGGASALLIKLPAIFCDLAAVALIYRAAEKRMRPGAALALATLYAFNPLAIVTGAAWGQVDSVPALLLVLVLLYAMEGKWRWALPIFVLAALMKPQALMFGPLGLVALVIDLWRGPRQDRWRDLMIGVGLSLLCAVIVVLPFSIKQGGVSWLIKLYGDTMNFYDYATVNATNLYFLFGLNWQPVTGPAPFALRLLGGLTLVLPALIYLFGVRAVPAMSGRPDLSSKERLLVCLALLPALAVVILPLTLGQTGTLLMVSGFLLALLIYSLRPDMQKLPLLGAVLLILFCELGVMMHERYLFPAALLLMLAYVLRRDRKTLWLMIAVSLLTYLNVAVALDRSIRIGGVDGHLAAPLFGIASDSAWLEYLLSALHTLMAFGAAYVGLMSLWDDVDGTAPFARRVRAWQGDAERIARARREARKLLHEEAPGKMRGKDRLIVLLVTALYAALALSNLGATTAPETVWTSKSSDETLIYDLGSVRRFKLLYYPGIQWADNDPEVSASDDLKAWIGKPMSLRPGDCFAWRYQTEKSASDQDKYSGIHVIHKGRYLRIEAQYSQSSIYEIIARDAATGEDIPLQLISGDGEMLIDEQDQLIGGEPSWYNSAYFDEIYHARTGFEQANALRGLKPDRIYETSHPPLGKFFITLSILIFGMNPFGWRLAGALAGVLMLPGMYMMAKMLTKRRLFALCAMLLMAFDHMHFAQTRIATIDSFVTLFIIWAYVFMLRFALTPLDKSTLRQDIGTLFLSGLMVGLSVASKWTGIYAGLGLAAIFFIALWHKTKEGMAAQAMGEDESAPGSETAPSLSVLSDLWQPRLLLTLASCLISFVLVPLLIYYFSFIPVFMQTDGGLTIKKVVEASQGMLSYHGTPGLGMDHYFYSPWYEWPLMLRPMWFYSGKRLADTGSTIVTFGNLAVWWGGLAALLLCCGIAVRRALPMGDGEDVSWKDRMGLSFLIIGFMAQYLPWIPVPRGTYIYHYFPALPFIILCAAYLLSSLSAKRPRLAKRLTIGYLLVAAAFFIAFFPYASGIRVSSKWLSALQWFPNWLHY